MLQNFITLLLYFSFVIYALLGIFTFILNRDDKANQVFAILCLCFSIWGFTFSMANSSGSIEEAVFWRRFSVLGWGVAYSLILHFVIVLTNHDWRLSKKRTLILLFLYLPALFNIFIFGIYSKTANAQLVLVRSTAGWITIPVNNLPDMLFYLYYIGFSMTFLFLLWKWYRSAKSSIDKKKALYMMVSFIVALALGSFTDLLANVYFGFKLPSMAPVVIMIPIATIFYTVYRYGLMRPVMPTVQLDEGIILTADSRTKLFKYVGIVLTIGSMINFFDRINQADYREAGILFSFVLMVLAAIIIIIPYLVKGVRLQEALLAILLIATLPIVMLSYIDEPFSNLIWPIPIFAIMITVIFNNKRIFFGVALVSLFMGFLYWAFIPEKIVLVGSHAYFYRLAFYGISISLTALIGKIYVARLEDNARQEEFQKMITEISVSFVTMTSADFDHKVNILLKKSSCYIQAERAVIGIFSKDFTKVYYSHLWTDKGPKFDRESGNPLVGHNEFTTFAWSTTQLTANKIVWIKNLDKLPNEAAKERKWLETQGILSQILIPIPSKDRIIGYIGYDQFSKEKSWQIKDHDQLRVLANILSDAIAKVENEKEMNRRAYYDSLTGLPNRTLFTEKLDDTLAVTKFNNQILGVVFVDLDGFKEINDTMGHDWGDHLLCEIGKRLTSCIRRIDTIGRFGGDEFLIMIPGFSERQDLNAVITNVMNVFKNSVLVNDQEFHITASAGVAVYPDDGETVQALIKNADLAMYEAKTNGKNKYAFCSEAMKAGVLKKMTLTNSLYRALERQELFLHYQPQVCIKTQSIIGFEALLRWQHPEWGMISPAVFIPLAEQTGLINSIGEWVLMTACKQNKNWQDQGHQPVQMAVNLSLEQFRSGHVEKLVASCLKKTGLEPRYLELEITEGIAMRESDYVIECLHKLKQIGVTISIDDFGTEFSSLGRLKDLPVDRLKIDMQFIRGIGINIKDEAIIAVMIHLAKRLNLKVIAEGVETREQMLFLRDEDCDEIQGYFYYQPMSSDAIASEIYNNPKQG